MPIVNSIGEWNILFIPAIVAGLTPANQQHCGSTRVERIKDPVRPSLVLNTQLTHVRVTRRLDAGGVRHPQRRTNLLQKAYREVHAFLFRGG